MAADDDGSFKKFIKHKDWFDYHKDFRDPLVHRIPPYVPHYTVSKSGKKMVESFFISDFKNSYPVPFHPQIIADTKTFLELVKVGLSSLSWLLASTTV